MNLTKLFEIQKALRDRISYNGEDRFEKEIEAAYFDKNKVNHERQNTGY